MNAINLDARIADIADSIHMHESLATIADCVMLRGYHRDESRRLTARMEALIARRTMAVRPPVLDETPLSDDEVCHGLNQGLIPAHLARAPMLTTTDRGVRA